MRISDWSSDVCSSDLLRTDLVPLVGEIAADRPHKIAIIDIGQRDRCIHQRARVEIGVVGRRGDRLGGKIARSIGHIAVERSEEHTSDLQSLMRISYAVFCLKKKTKTTNVYTQHAYRNPNTQREQH